MSLHWGGVWGGGGGGGGVGCGGGGGGGEIRESESTIIIVSDVFGTYDAGKLR